MRPRTFRHSNAWLPLVAFLCIAAPAPAEWAPNDAQQEGLEAINAIRKDMGLPLFRLDERLCRAASAHSAYVYRHRAIPHRSGHEENPGLEGFTGAMPSDRARAAGYTAGAGESIGYSLGHMGVTTAVRRLLDAPYHRGLWMRLGVADVGVGIYGNVLTVNYYSAYQEGTIVYPYDGQTDVPVSWSNSERPDPRRIGKLPRTIGYPIVFQWEARHTDKMVFSGVTMADDAGHGVPVAVNSPQNDPELAYGYQALILPKQPLRPRTTYTVKVSAQTESGRDILRAWKFSTGDGIVDDRSDAEMETAQNISLRTESGAGNSVIVRVINLDARDTRSFTAKVRNISGRLMDSARLKIPPNASATCVLKGKEPVYSVVLSPDGLAEGIPITRRPNAAVQVRSR